VQQLMVSPYSRQLCGTQPTLCGIFWPATTSSHLSQLNGDQRRIYRKRTGNNQQLQTQRQLFAIFFCVALSMKTYGRPTGTETAFLQGITSMAEAATRAAVAAERALERATSALQVVVFMMAFREPPAF
jgi:hypothetical protein